MGESAQSLDLASYIANLSADIKEQVFGSSWTAQALFRALTPLAKQYILRLVYIDGGVQQGALCCCWQTLIWLPRSLLEEAN